MLIFEYHNAHCSSGCTAREDSVSSTVLLLVYKIILTVVLLWFWTSSKCCSENILGAVEVL